MDLQPQSAPTVVQVDEAKDETDSGLLLTSASKEQPTIGKVCSSRLLLIQQGSALEACRRVICSAAFMSDMLLA